MAHDNKQEKKELLIAALQSGKSLNMAAKHVGVTTGGIWKWRKEDPIFANNIDFIVNQRRNPSSPELDRKRVFHKNTDFTDSQKAQALNIVIDAMESGLNLKYATLRASVSSTLIQKWIADDRDLREKLNNAEGTFQLGLIKKVMCAAERDWRAAAWLLERRFPHLWGEVKALEVSERKKEVMTKIVEVSEVMKKEYSKMTDEELRRELQNDQTDLSTDTE